MISPGFMPDFFKISPKTAFAILPVMKFPEELLFTNFIFFICSNTCYIPCASPSFDFYISHIQQSRIYGRSLFWRHSIASKWNTIGAFYEVCIDLIQKRNTGNSPNIFPGSISRLLLEFLLGFPSWVNHSKTKTFWRILDVIL